jgi:hypothetical protein
MRDEVMGDERFVLLLDILGFKQLVAAEPLAAISAKVQRLLAECEEWASGETKFGFDTIHFSDTVLLYTQETGFYKEWFDDLVYIGSRICSAMFATGVPVRGALSYGSFLVEKSGRHQTFVGQALIDAHEAESNDKGFMGLKVTSPTWRRVYLGPTAPAGLHEMGVGIVQPDDTLLINFLTEFVDLDKRQLAFNVEHYFTHPGESDNPWIPVELEAFRFIREMANKYAATPNDRVGQKYVNTLEFFRRVFGPHLYEVTNAIADDYGTSQNRKTQ